jgi:Tfp pilus assembly protein PilX
MYLLFTLYKIKEANFMKGNAAIMIIIVLLIVLIVIALLGFGYMHLPINPGWKV